MQIEFGGIPNAPCDSRKNHPEHSCFSFVINFDFKTHSDQYIYVCNYIYLYLRIRTSLYYGFLKNKKNNIENDNAGEKKKTNIDAKKTDKKNKTVKDI